MKTTFAGVLSLFIFLVPVSSAVGQWTIPILKLPKITIPKIKSEKPQTKVESPTTAATTSSSDSSSLTPDKGGKPIPGAKITFSTTPDGGAPSTNFKSSDFIYGKLDLGGKTVYDAFGLKGLGERDFYFIRYSIDITQDGNPREFSWVNGFEIVLITKEDANKTSLTFDVVPDPAKLTTISCSLDDDIDYCRFSAGMYKKTRNVDTASSTFPKDGTYYVDVTLWMLGYDGWGKVAGYETSPVVGGELTYQFSMQDGQTLVANAKKASASAENAKNMKEMLRAMPNWWARGKTPPDAKLSPARLTPMIKGFLDQWNITYFKHTIVSFTGPLWVIEKDSFNLPSYRMVVPYIYVLYKDPKDNACKIGALYMRESYAGGGRYGEPYLGGIRDVQFIDCAVVK